MKYNIYILLIILGFASCDSFLEEKSKDKIHPKTVKDYEEMLYGSVYLDENFKFANYLDIMTDDAELKIKTGSHYTVDGARKQGYGYYTWQSEPEKSVDGKRYDDELWGSLYRSILLCNIVIADSSVIGSVDEKKHLEAEARFIRAFNYFHLVNIYGMPYKKETAETDIGVPINNLTIANSSKLKTASVSNVYELVKDDIQKSVKLFKEIDIEKNYFRANKNAAFLLASRVALYMKEYDDAIKYASEGIRSKGTLRQLANWDSWNVAFTDKNPEILFTFGDDYNFFFIDAYVTKSCYVVSADLKNSFCDNDIRKEKYINYYGEVNKVDDETETKVFGHCFRTVEFYLNRAEAYAEQNLLIKAKGDMDYFRSTRYSGNSVVNIGTQEDMIQLVRDERRKELCFEKHRWFDLRRWGTTKLRHKYFSGSEGEEEQIFELEKDEAAWTIPAPMLERELNPNISLIQRKNRKPIRK